ncbi:MAG TPA: hypothetical protein VE954_42325 [Oligoflexus sp.]|uniref:hypothetical protein n=1 Tax=Oligoflexus sp. TaxID=1971216 RepID=UPI002D30B352|nr:hypothetical protein [Oligoflexus sp.]HYX39778.1 hypothetical protein [Oligoflexus sp.]
MKLIHLPVLSLVLASMAPAADLSPNRMGTLLQKPLAPSSYRLGLAYDQSEDEGTNQFIQRRLNLAAGLPAQLEFGFGLIDTQEPSIDHASKPLGGQVWLRWNMIQSSLVTAGATLQFQPGLATRESSRQASQDRTSLGLDLNLTPWSWMSSAVYASYSRRQDERYQQLTLGEENLFGMRLTLGTENFGVYGDGSQRHLLAHDLETGTQKKLFAREWQAGLYVGTPDVQLKTFAMIPDTHRYFGMPERGFGASLTLIIGGVSSPADTNETHKSDVVKTTESATPSEPELKILETNEMDEFQLLEKKAHEAAKNQKETPAEKAEREIRQSLEAEKKIAAQKIIDDEKAQREAAQAWQKRVQENDDAYHEYKDDVNSEINQYALPDQDDLNWNGLTP